MKPEREHPEAESEKHGDPMHARTTRVVLRLWGQLACVQQKEAAERTNVAGCFPHARVRHFPVDDAAQRVEAQNARIVFAVTQHRNKSTIEIRKTLPQQAQSRVRGLVDGCTCSDLPRCTRSRVRAVEILQCVCAQRCDADDGDGDGSAWQEQQRASCDVPRDPTYQPPHGKGAHAVRRQSAPEYTQLALAQERNSNGP